MCFLPVGPDKHLFVAAPSDDNSLDSVGLGSVYEKKPVVGDQTALPVLDCLIYIAQLYGEPVLTYQYLPYVGYLVRMRKIWLSQVFAVLTEPFSKNNMKQMNMSNKYQCESDLVRCKCWVLSILCNTPIPPPRFLHLLHSVSTHVRRRACWQLSPSHKRLSSFSLTPPLWICWWRSIKMCCFLFWTCWQHRPWGRLQVLFFQQSSQTKMHYKSKL